MSIAKISMLGWVTTLARRNIQREILSAEISMSTAKISMLGWVTTQARKGIFKKKFYQQKNKKIKKKILSGRLLLVVTSYQKVVK